MGHYIYYGIILLLFWYNIIITSLLRNLKNDSYRLRITNLKTFSSESDVSKSSVAFSWPKNIEPIFMNNTLLVEQTTQDFQTALKEKREILIADIEKEQMRIAEFDQCGDFNAVKSYVADCTGIQKRLVQYERNIEAINQEERHVSD